MRLVRFSTAGGPPRLGAVLGRWDHWEKIVDLSAVDSAIPADTLEFIDACPGLKGDVWDRSLRVLAEAEKIESDARCGRFDRAMCGSIRRSLRDCCETASRFGPMSRARGRPHGPRSHPSGTRCLPIITATR